MPRVKKIQEDKPGDWQTIFCCLAIILVAFFVMLCSYATLERGKIVEVRRSFQGALEIFPGGILFDKGEGITIPSPDYTGQMSNRVATPIYQFLKGKGLEEKITLKSTSDYISLNILDSLIFIAGSAEITAGAQPILKKLSNILSGFSLPVRIEGHTDDKLIKSDRYHSNWELSAMRAVNIMKFLKKEGDIPADKISAIGFSQYRPFVPNKTDVERARNRRVEIIIPIVQDFFEKRENIIRKAPPSFKVWDLKS